MAKSLFEELGGKYERQGDYLIPCLTVPAEEEQAIQERFNLFHKWAGSLLDRVKRIPASYW